MLAHREMNGGRRVMDSLSPFSELLMRAPEKEGDASIPTNLRGGKKRDLAYCCMLGNCGH